jgi:hypothetical protein
MLKSGEKCLIQLCPPKFVIYEFFRKAMCVVSFNTVSILCFINLKYRVYFENKTNPLHENYSEEFHSICVYQKTMEPNSASLFFLTLISFSFHFQGMTIFIPYLWHILTIKHGLLNTVCLIIWLVNGRHTFTQSLLYSISPLVLQDVYAPVEPALNCRFEYG